MTFYDKDGKPYNYDIGPSSFIGEGTTGKVYKINDKECLKCIDYGYFPKGLFQLLNNMDLNGFIKLGIPFYKNYCIIAYTMEYLKKSFQSILDKPTDYTIDNFEIIYNDVVKLSSCGIKLYDLCWKNMIVGEEIIKVIDFDYYDKTLENDVYFFNVDNLVNAFKFLYLDAVKNDSRINVSSMLELIDFLDCLFDIDGYYDNPVSTLKKMLVGVKRPRDLFLR